MIIFIIRNTIKAKIFAVANYTARRNCVVFKLIIISVKSLFGFLGEYHSKIDWELLLSFSSLAVIGIFLGVYLGRFFDGQKLKKSFSVFVFLIAIFIILKEVFII